MARGFNKSAKKFRQKKPPAGGSASGCARLPSWGGWGKACVDRRQALRARHLGIVGYAYPAGLSGTCCAFNESIAPIDLPGGTEFQQMQSGSPVNRRSCCDFSRLLKQEPDISRNGHALAKTAEIDRGRPGRRPSRLSMNGPCRKNRAAIAKWGAFGLEKRHDTQPEPR